MGKNKRRKAHSPKLAAAKKPARPDDYFQKGPFKVARFGTSVVMRKDMTEQQHEEFQKRLAAKFPNIVAEIDTHVARIIAIVEQFSPLSLMARGYMGNFLQFIRPPEEGEEQSDPSALRMVDYIQSVIAAVPPKAPELPPITEEAWGELHFPRSSGHALGVF